MPRYAYAITVRCRLARLHRTQRQLAAAIGYSPSYISMVLSGKCPAPHVRAMIDRQIKLWERT